MEGEDIQGVSQGDAAAREQLNMLQNFVDDSVSIKMLASRVGINVTRDDLDKPLSIDFEIPGSSHGFSRTLRNKAMRDGMTVRELYNLVAVFHSDHYVEGWDAAGDPALLWKHFEGQQPQVLRMLEKINAWKMWVLCDREPVKNWTADNVTLLGDAAHPMLQYLAQGACMALEDAVRLAREVEASPGNLNAAFLAYQQKRYLRTARVQLMARIYGEFYHARGPAAELRDQMLGARTDQQSLDGISWLYSGDLEP